MDQRLTRDVRVGLPARRMSPSHEERRFYTAAPLCFALRDRATATLTLTSAHLLANTLHQREPKAYGACTSECWVARATAPRAACAVSSERVAALACGAQKRRRRDT